MSGVRINWRARPDLRFSLQARSVSEFFDDLILTAPDGGRLDGYAVAGFTASWDFRPGWELRARLDNLTDETYQTAYGFPGAPRGARLLLGRDFKR